MSKYIQVIKISKYNKMHANTLEKLKKLGIFRLKGAYKIGVSQPTISRIAAAGEIMRLGHGFYMCPDTDVSPEERDYAIACYKFGKKSIIGGITALTYYNLLAQSPQQVWVIVPQEIRTTDDKYRLLRVKKLSRVGVKDHKLFRITNIERTLVEAFQYSSKIGIRTAISATIKAITDKKTTLSNIMKMAKKLGYENSIKKYWETLIGAMEE